MKYFTLSAALFIISNLTYSQFAPESDPHRGMYVDKFVKFINNDYFAPFSILAVDTNFDGIFEKEDELLTYACENHITYLNFYDVNRILGRQITAWDENLHQHVDLEEHLCRFIKKAKDQYGVTQIGMIGGSATFFDSLTTFLDRYPLTSAMRIPDDIRIHASFDTTLNMVERTYPDTDPLSQQAEFLKFCLRIMNFNSGNRCEASIDVLNIEHEFWGDCAGEFEDFTATMEAMKSLKEVYNQAHPNNKLITEAYLAFLSYCNPTPGILPVIQTIDGCNNCDPCPSCTNPHEELIDRVLLTSLRNHPVNWDFSEQNLFENSSTADSTDFHMLLYAESIETGGVSNYLGQWFTQHPFNNIFTAEDYYFYYWLTFSNAAFGQPRQNDVQAGGVQWFAARNMVGHLDDPKVIQTPGTFCTANDSALIDFRYLGPDEPGTDYEFHVTRDSDGAVVYPVTGTPLSGTSHSNIPNPGLRAIDFTDSIAFPPCILPLGEYTAHLTLRYNHSTGCSYTSTAPVIVADMPRIQVSGDTAFCYGGHTFLEAPAGGSYIWYLDSVAIPNSNSQVLKVTKQGNYFCDVALAGCSGRSDTIYIAVHPMPAAEVNGLCNGNGTVTLKTNLLPYQSSSTNQSGPGGVIYQWNTGATTDQIVVGVPTSRTTYRVNITDRYSGCTIYREIFVPSTPNTTYSASITVNSQPSSPCSNDGSLTVAVSPAVFPFDPINYLWSNGETTQTISNLAPGAYSVIMSYWKSACSFEASVTIGTTPGNSPVVNATLNDASCFNRNDGSITLSVSGGAPPFTYYWPNLPQPALKDQSGLYTGIYSVRITDSNGCEFNHEFIIDAADELPEIDITSITPVTGCGNNNNGAAEVSASGAISPYTFQWNDPQSQTGEVVSNLAAGTYTVTVTSQSGCSDMAFVHIPSEEREIYVDVLDSTSTTTGCLPEGSIYLHINGGVPPYTVNAPWTVDSFFTFVEELPDTSISLLITDANGCTFAGNYLITQTAISSLVLDSSSLELSCDTASDGALYIELSGGQPPYSVNLPWTADSNLVYVTGLPDTTISLQLTDNNGCTLNQNFTITSPNFNSSITPLHTSCTGCADGSIAVSVSGGHPPYSISWLPANGSLSSDTITALVSGTYEILVTDSAGCIISGLTTVLDDPLSVINDRKQITKLYPNPTTGIIFIESQAVIGSIKITDIHGRMVFQNTSPGKFQSIDLSSHSSGIYFITLFSGEHVVRKKITLSCVD